ncbi:MAG TPA: hypothetical protein VLB68_24540 [Pyrinomonadaceae bacterium]|nr:hypothetical protein [Pyrinomonadaceae bacterium]
MKIMQLTLIIVLIFASKARAQEPKSELHLYERATQIGTVANREFKDEKGRVVKAIYYTQSGIPTGPIKAELLREQSIRTYSYNVHDCKIIEQHYEPGPKLSRTYNTECLDGTAIPRLTTIVRADGTREGEVRHSKTGSRQTILYFDKSGQKVVAISGQLAADIDLVHGWGQELDGFAAGIAPNQEKGRPQDLSVLVNIKNVSHSAEGMITMSPVLVELKDANGRIVGWKFASEAFVGNDQADHCPAFMKEGAPLLGRSQQRAEYGLNEQFGRLAPGRYSMTVSFCVSGQQERLVSNTIFLEVEP